MQNIPQVPGNLAKAGQNHDAPKVVSATLSVLKRSGTIFRPRSSKVSVQKVFLCRFQCKQRLAEVRLESQGLENILEVRENEDKGCQNEDTRKVAETALRAS